MRKYGIIDIGTNSMRLLIATVNGDKIVHRKKYLISTRMGQGVDQSGIISCEAMDRNIQALKELKQISLDNHTEEMIIFGTSALRDAENGKDFVSKIKSETSLNVDIISGELEAQYAFLGVVQEYPNENLMIMDIGGGSTEIVATANNNAIYAKSMDMGAVRLTEKFIRNDPPQAVEMELLKGYIDNMISSIELPFIRQQYGIVGIGGTATTIVSMLQKLQSYDASKIHGSKVELEEISDILQSLTTRTNKQRKEIIGLNPQRADIIIAGIYIVQRILKYFEKSYFIVSDYDNLEGALVHVMRK
ncbi:MAG: Ppx/GppA family phosphatase [Eubacteriales bacterium]